MESCKVAGSGSAGSPYGASVAQEHYNGSGVRVPLPVEPHLARCLFGYFGDQGWESPPTDLLAQKKKGGPCKPHSPLYISVCLLSNPGVSVTGTALRPALNHTPRVPPVLAAISGHRPVHKEVSLAFS